MRKKLKLILLCICIILATGCSKNTKANRKLNTSNSVDKVLNEQINNSTKEDNENDVKKAEQETTTVVGVETEQRNYVKKEMFTVDYDLTSMSSDMVYATVFQMVNSPEQYENKSFKISGTYYSIFYEPTGKYYHYCIIQDATACCAQGIEFVWDDGAHVYPDEYPERGTQVVISGIFETYTENDGKSMYCRLADASLAIK